MNDDFFIWAVKLIPNAATLVDLEGFEKSYELMKGISHAADFPDVVTLRMDSRKPTDTLLPDNVNNTQNVVIVSAKLKEFLQSAKLKDVEFLAVRILDHKDRVVDEPYFIFHPINNVECLALEQCQPRWSAIDETLFTKVKKLVIDKNKVPEGKAYFRPLHYPGRPVVTRELAESVIQAGFSGVQFLPASSITGRIE